MAYDYQRIRTRMDRGVLYATIDNPPSVPIPLYHPS